MKLRIYKNEGQHLTEVMYDCSAIFQPDPETLVIVKDNRYQNFEETLETIKIKAEINPLTVITESKEDSNLLTQGQVIKGLLRILYNNGFKLIADEFYAPSERKIIETCLNELIKTGGIKKE